MFKWEWRGTLLMHLLKGVRLKILCELDLMFLHIYNWVCYNILIIVQMSTMLHKVQPFLYSVTPCTGLSEMRTSRLCGHKYKVPIVARRRRTYLTNLWFTDTSIFRNADIYPCTEYINAIEIQSLKQTIITVERKKHFSWWILQGSSSIDHSKL